MRSNWSEKNIRYSDETDPSAGGICTPSSGRSTPSTVNSRLSGTTLVGSTSMTMLPKRRPKASTSKGDEENPKPKISTKLTAVDEDGRHPLPALERSVDLLLNTTPRRLPAHPSYIFEQLVPCNNASNNSHPLFRLSSLIRHKIYGFCFPSEDRKVSLSPRFAISAVFGMEYFASPGDILFELVPALGSFRMLRWELMSYFWTEYHFHVTLNPLSGPLLSPLSHIWLYQYLDIIQRLDVELDLTRFGCSALTTGPAFWHGIAEEKVMKLFSKIIMGIVGDRTRLPMTELNLMCRRYKGYRPINKTYKGDQWSGPGESLCCLKFQ